MQKEIQRKATDQRGYKIIQLDSSGGGFYADLGSESPTLFEQYTVVRKDRPVEVPSLNANIDPEMWVGTAELRHIHAGVGHFKLTGKRWVEGQGLSKLTTNLGLGRWEEFDKKTEQVVVGDYVLKNDS